MFLISCLNQTREIYPNEFIVAVDNGSLNDKWQFDYCKRI